MAISKTRGGEDIVEGFTDDDYMVEVDWNHNGGKRAEVHFRYVDANNSYIVRLNLTNMNLIRRQNGSDTTLATAGYTLDLGRIRIKAAGTNIKVYEQSSSTATIDQSDSTFAAGGVALGGDKPNYPHLKIGYDTNAVNDISDAGDDLIVNEDFGGSSYTVGHDHAGNLIDDGNYMFVYNAWNLLVRTRASVDDVTIQTAEFDGQGRRIKKVVTNSYEHDGTFVYFYDGHKIIEVRNGSGSVVQQFIHGTQYIDELVMMRAKDKGDLYVHQDANWNVIALTDLGGSVVERNIYTPYGELTVHQETGYGDRDGDQDVDSTDKGTVGTTCTGTVTGACRILDLDFDGDYDSTDAGLFDALPQGTARHPGRLATGVNQPFAHQGLLLDAELMTYQNRARQYDPAQRRFLQRDGLRPVKLLTRQDALEALQPYVYLRSTPLARTDARGRDASCHGGENCCDTLSWGGPNAPAGNVLRLFVFVWHGSSMRESIYRAYAVGTVLYLLPRRPACEGQ